MKITFFVLFTSLLIFACNGNDSTNNQPQIEFIDREPLLDTMFRVTADIETEPIDAISLMDAADDPSVWIHPNEPSQSIVFGSDKTSGIAAYDLDGKELAYAKVGRINNIDVAYNLKLKNETIDICGGTNRSKDGIDIYKIHPNGELEYILEKEVKSNVNTVYGFCFYHSPKTSKNYAILCGKDGVIEQYEIKEGGEKLDIELIDSFDIGSQPEGLVADHKRGILYIGEENECIWKIDAEPGNRTPEQIKMTTREDNPNIDYDIEGLTIYYTSSDHGYLIASSQGNNSFAIYDRSFDNQYLGSFKIVEGLIDGNSDTDGIDVVNLNLGVNFPNGMFIAQDGRNLEPDSFKPQNFKYVKWEKIANLFEPPLYIDPDFNVRSLFE